MNGIQSYPSHLQKLLFSFVPSESSSKGSSSMLKRNITLFGKLQTTSGSAAADTGLCLLNNIQTYLPYFTNGKHASSFAGYFLMSDAISGDNISFCAFMYVTTGCYTQRSVVLMCVGIFLCDFPLNKCSNLFCVKKNVFS